MNINKSLKAVHLRKSNRRTIAGIVLHDTAGNGGIGDVRYLANPSDGSIVSVDFVIMRTGEIYKLNPSLSTFYSIHAGRSTFFKGYRNSSVNVHTIGIEICQSATLKLKPIYPESQVKAVADLCRSLVKEFKLKKTDITTHAKIITDGTRSDPRKFPFDKFWKYFDGQEASEPIIYIVQEGDTLWALARKFNTRVETLKMLNGINEMSNLIYVGQKLRIK